MEESFICGGAYSTWSKGMWYDLGELVSKVTHVVFILRINGILNIAVACRKIQNWHKILKIMHLDVVLKLFLPPTVNYFFK